MNELLLILGLIDAPAFQMQTHYYLDAFCHNLGIFGTAQSGKSTLVKTLLLRLHEVVNVRCCEEIYILDFGSALASYASLPFVKAYMDGSNDEHVRMMFSLLEEELVARKKRLTGCPFAHADATTRGNHITFVLDGLSSFLLEEENQRYISRLQRILREGIGRGISVVFTANDTAGGISKLLPSVQRVIALELGDKEQYASLFHSKVEPPVVRKGRGVANVDYVSVAVPHCEFQAYFPYNTNRFACEADALSALVQSFAAANINLAALEAAKRKSFTDDLTFENWHDFTPMPAQAEGKLVAGIAYNNMQPLSIDLKTAQSIAIYGKKHGGKSNLLASVLQGARALPEVRFVLLDDHRGGLDPVRHVFNEDAQHTVTTLYAAEDLAQFLREEGYYDVPKKVGMPMLSFGAAPSAVPETPFVKRAHPFTVFVIQNRLFYQTGAYGADHHVLARIAPYLSDAAAEQVLFVFADAKRFTEISLNNLFNANLSHAFLLDDILRFHHSNGQNTVFASLNSADLKEQFGLCENGDGFYFDIEGDEIHKLRFTKVIA